MASAFALWPVVSAEVFDCASAVERASANTMDARRCFMGLTRQSSATAGGSELSFQLFTF